MVVHRPRDAFAELHDLATLRQLPQRHRHVADIWRGASEFAALQVVQHATFIAKRHRCEPASQRGGANGTVLGPQVERCGQHSGVHRIGQVIGLQLPETVEPAVVGQQCCEQRSLKFAIGELFRLGQVRRSCSSLGVTGHLRVSWPGQPAPQ